MQTLYQWLRALVLGALLLALLAYPLAAAEGAREGIALFGSAVLPALLPFFVLSSLLAGSGLLGSLPGLSFLPRAFGCRGHLGGVMLLCFLTGAPTSARLLAQLHEEGALTATEAVRLGAVCTLTGPLFLLGTVGGLLGSPAIGGFVFLMQWLAACINGLLWRLWGGEKGETAPPPPKGNKHQAVLPLLPGALQASCNAILLVGVAVIVFSALRQMLVETGLFAWLKHALGFALPPAATHALLSGLMEVSLGCKAAATASLPFAARLGLCCAIASFGGFSILVQSACFLQTLLPMRLYFLQRLSHGVLGFVLCYACAGILEVQLPAVAGLQMPATPAGIPAGAGYALLGCALLISWLWRLSGGRPGRLRR